MLVPHRNFRRLGTSKPKGVRVASITDGLALKAIAFTLVGDSHLQARRTLKTNCLVIDGYKLPWQPHAARLLIQLVN
jgi:hypothetical protein